MPELDLTYEPLPIKFTRGDAVAFDAVIYDKSVDPKVPLLDLPATGWRGHIRAAKGQTIDPPLASLVIDATDVGTTATLHVALLAADGVTLPDKCYWDIENTTTQFTYVGGIFKVEGQVSQ